MNDIKFSIAKLFVVLLSFTFAIAGCKATESATNSGKSPSGVRGGAADDGEMKKYSEVITKDAVSDEGLFDVHKVKDKYYYEIPDTLLGREMLLVTRVAKTADNVGYGGEKLNTQIVRWEKKDKKILLRHVSFENVATDTMPIYEAVRNSNFEPI
ncbi:MAG: DUF5118 domain-containing protein, partial [Gracilimonas sp.]